MNYNIEDIAKIYNKLLGNSHFNIEVNCNLNLQGETVQGVMYAARRPFSVTGLLAETIDLSFEFFVSVRNNDVKLDVLNELTKIMGTKKGSFISNGAEFSYDSFLEFGRPSSSPVIDMGDYTQVILVNGSVFISAKDGGVKMSNDIKTYITFKGIRGRVFPKITNVANVRDLDAPTKANQNESSAEIKSQGVSRSLTIYDLRNELCEELEKYIEVNAEDDDLNEPITIERVYPGFTVTKNCVLISASIQEVPGAFLCIDLVLQKQESTLNEE